MAAWAQMLNYIITVAISAFFVPHYLSIFWEPLRTNPWDIIGGAAVILILVAINIVGIKEAAGLNVFLAVVDFATQLLLVIIGFAIVFDPHVLTANVHWGIAPTWGNFALAIPVAMIAYTGIETVSNLAEEARDPTRSIPASIRLVAVAVFAIYFTLPLVALSALPVYKDAAGDYVTKLGLPPDQGGFENDPVLGLVENLGLHGWVLSAGKVYVGILAATILFIATNAGVIGASRITYSMAMLPAAAGGLPSTPPALQDPVALADRLRRRDPDRRAAAGEGQLPRNDVLVRRDAVVHDRARLDHPAPPQEAGARGVPRPAEPPHRRPRPAAVRAHRRARHVARLGRRRRPVSAGALGRPRLAGGRVGLLLAVPHAASSGSR